MPGSNLDWEDKLALAREAADRLDGATDTLNSVIEMAEKAIASLGLGVPGRVLIEATENKHSGITFCRSLLFWKQDKVWRLLVASGDEGDDEDECIPLRNASRDVRLLAVKHLSSLVDDMIQTAVSEVAEVESATEAARIFIQNLAAADKRGK
jgi:hypothetical protein